MHIKRKIITLLLAGALMVPGIPSSARASSEDAIAGALIATAIVGGFIVHYIYTNNHASKRTRLIHLIDKDLKQKAWGYQTHYNKDEVMNLAKQCFSYISWISRMRLISSVKQFYNVLEDYKNNLQKPVEKLKNIKRDIEGILHGSY